MIEKRNKSLLLITLTICSIITISCIKRSDYRMKEKYAEALQHYSLPQDSLKRKALLFLLENMDDHFGIDPATREQWVDIYRELYEISEREDFNFKHDYLRDKGIQTEQQTKFIADTTVITSAELIENIDLAFEAWQKPWAKHLPFDEFCAYILPYRVKKEPYRNGWRRFFIDELRPLTDSIEQEGITDPFKVTEIISSWLHRGNRAYISPVPEINVVDFYRYPIGDCEKWFTLHCLAARAIGLPLAIDFNLQFTRFPGDHSGTALTNDGTGKLISFTMNEDHSLSTFIFDGVKIYREEFARQPIHFVNHFFPRRRFSRIKDVTALYSHHFPMKNIVVPAPAKKWKGNIYFCCFGVGEEIIPLDCPEIKNDSVYLKELLLSTDPLFLFCSLNEKKNTFTPLCNPFSISKEDGSIHPFNPDTATTEIINMRRKYPILYDEETYFGAVIGSYIQGSDDRQFRRPVTLDSVKASDVETYYEFLLPPHKPFRYYRYIQLPGKPINLAELHFVTEKNKRLSRYFTDTPGNIAALQNLCDEKIITNYIDKKTNWVAIDTEENPRESLVKAGVLARNSLNNIEKNNLYELFYFDMGWHSLGQVTSRGLMIRCKVPKNAIFLLKNHTTGRQERIFMYENGEQNFW